MAYPHPTPDVPGQWPHLYEEVKRCLSNDDVSVQLLSALDHRGDLSGRVAAGHVCATTWVFDPAGRYTLLVHHRLFAWSAPGGHIERSETSREGGLRELEEETGLTRFDVTSILDAPALVHVSDLPGDRPHRHWNIAWLYTAEMDSPLSPVEGARWWSVESLPSGPPDLASTTSRLRALLDRHRIT
ncbi:MAG: NUDIX domain-containing protein [Actinomycetota bacterium]